VTGISKAPVAVDQDFGVLLGAGGVMATIGAFMTMTAPRLRTS